MIDVRKLLAVICILSLSFGQGPPDNIGREFVVSFMENDEYGNVFPLELYVTTSEKHPVHVTITSPKWTKPSVSETVTVTPGQVVRVNISDEFRMKGSLKSSKALLVKSDGDIAVYGGNKEDYSNDVFCGIPTDALGNEYYAMCYGPAYRKTELGVAATQDNTVVKVTLPKAPNMTVTYNSKTYHGGDMITINLDKYENFQLQSIGDLTGAHIEATHPVSAYSGNIKTNIGTGKFQDHLVEQLTPVDTWGKKFVTAPIPKRTVGDYFRVVASEDNTVVKIAGMPSFTLAKAGDWKQIQLPSSSYKSINASKPVLMAQFVLSQLNKFEPADPSMMIIPPYELFNSGYTFATPEYSHPEYFKYENQILLVIESSKKDGLLLDGKPLPKGTKWNPIEGTSLVGTYVDIPKGSHSVVHKDSYTIFGSYLYGHAYHESYAFPTGMRLAKINAPCTPTKSVDGDGLDNDCDDDDGDGKIDEDCTDPTPVDGLWGSWGPWSGSCSVTCGKGVLFRNRTCDDPAPLYNGKNCIGSGQDSKPCDTGVNCPLDPSVACKNNPHQLLANPVNCAQYYDCSQKTSSMGQDYLKECKYPDLFSTVNTTRTNATGLTPTCNCPKRLPSCIGKTDGDQMFPGKRGDPAYITCFKNRTMNIAKCKPGYFFEPRGKMCRPMNAAVLRFFCRAHSADKVPDLHNCAKYQDCSKNPTASECTYPDLFSTVTGKCENFTTVKCEKRQEPQAPCEYDQNLCPSGNATCQKCPERLPSCIGLPDGDNPIPNHKWTSRYITCYKNRTLLPVHKCPAPMIYHPIKKICTEDIQPKEVPDFCKANPTAVIPSLTNCAEFYNCSDGNKAHECQYPDLFSKISHKCENFTGVQCNNRTEPQAPCEYNQNLCNGKPGCISCPKRLPSCVGKPDGVNHSLANCGWRTMSNVIRIGQFDVPDYCTAHPSAILPDPANCAHYFNCSDPTMASITRGAGQTPGNYRKECHYPDLFDDSIKQCNNFEMVNCSKKPEPQAPCEYQQNLCQAVNKTCDPCTKRLPSCVGKSDGLNPFPAKMWQADYVRCYKNRTMAVTKCPTGEYFNPRLDKCMKVVQPVDIPDYCKVHPTAMIPDPTNCAKFYNCSQNMATKTAVASECKYPDLFADVSQKCERFQNVSCKSRMEPQAPCEYDQNLCKPGDMNCELCPKRLPSCRGLPDGDEAVQSALWTDLYVTCLINRTMAVRHCPVGQVFDPSQLHCVSKIPKGNIDAFCLANPTSIVPHPDTCGQYYNCSAMSKYGHHLQECQYPDLFDDVSLMCKDFEQVNCNKSKHEPEAPCEYLQNRCNVSDPSCLPCPKRLPSCVGHPDGDNSFPNKLWMSDYITCYKNRTLNITHCSHGYFNPRTAKCEDDVPKVDVPDYCTAHPSAVLPDPDNCAHYFNCSDPTMATITRGAGQTPGNYRKECHYPDLFDDSIKQCNNFEMVNCSKKPEPQAPCEYQQNLCQAVNKTCDPCTKRLPSCVGKSDGLNPFPAKLWQADYVRCYKNRTMAVTKCPTGEYFNPRLDKCMKVVQPVDIPDYCKVHPTAMIPDPTNCAKFYNCSQNMATKTAVTSECKYPDLFSDVSQKCERFQNVSCKSRMEPQAPCKFTTLDIGIKSFLVYSSLKSIKVDMTRTCKPGDMNCELCPKHFTKLSCGLPDGDEAVNQLCGQIHVVTCLINRTIWLSSYRIGQVFDPSQQALRQ
ncbi:unnamed protein product [Mytilus edulis]|uniref:Chitin-binding type-2 domain-containing protein n=1 Tax=Mytilus edulis TaxID=6550 RepID=A0A8S3PVL6_MYTED|nr:unnamed protein product [Mytilus edulis]